MVQKLSLEKNVFNKKCSPKFKFLDEFFFWKNSVDFWHRKLTLKVQFWHFLRPWHYVNLQNTAISFEYSWFLSKNLAFEDPSSKKLHDLTDINVLIIRRVITHRTICFYSPNTLFLKVSVHQLIPFIYFSTFLCKYHLYSKEYTTQAIKNELYNVYTSYNLYMDVPFT